MSTVVTVVSSPGPGSRLDAVRHAAHEVLTSSGHQVKSIELRDLPHSALMTGDTGHPAVRWTHRLIAGAAAIVLITPSYQAGCGVVVRSWLELLPPVTLHARPVQAIGVGLTHAQASGLDYTFRTLLAGREATVLPSCFLFERWIAMDALTWKLGPAGEEALGARLGQLNATIGRDFAAA